MRRSVAWSLPSAGIRQPPGRVQPPQEPSPPHREYSARGRARYPRWHEPAPLHSGRWFPPCPSNDMHLQPPEETNPSSLPISYHPVSYTHLRAHETDSYLVCRLLLEKKK